jgi:phage tail P2-like protein
MGESVTDSLLPYNATAPERALEGAAARVSDVPVLVRESWDPDTCPAALLPWLAWAFSVDKWDANWTEEQKRAAIKASVFVHRHKGTPAALQAALDALGYQIEAVEWHQVEPKRAPYTFGVVVEVVDDGLSDVSDFETIIDVANSAKNVRSHMDFITVESTRSGTLWCGGVTFSGAVISIQAGD